MDSKKAIRVFIAEDEPYPRKLLLRYIEERSELKFEDFAETGDEALDKINAGAYDLLFIDINMPVLSGIEVVERLTRLPYVIFTTAYDQYAIKAFELGAIDYILKPFDRERFNKAVDRALSMIGKPSSGQRPMGALGLSCRDDRNHHIIPFDEIIYLESQAKHTVVHTTAKDLRIHSLLKDIAGRLPVKNFKRVHKQYIANFDYVSHVKYYSGGQYVIFLDDDEKTTIPMGRKYYEDLKDIVS
ncbi:MAG: response regulator transcription factor [Spirochaetes bacterium]|nr:response regulator transcription factor [Spirochaetota bacterium]